MYHLALFVDNRKYHISQLRSATGQQADTLVPSFVLERALDHTRTLLSIPYKAKLIKHGGFDEDCTIDWATARPEQTADGVRLNLKAVVPTAKPAPTPTSASVADGIFQVRRIANRCHLSVNAATSPHQIMVTIVVDVAGTSVEQSLRFHLVPKELIHDVVLDFGSEASQVVISQRGKTDKLSRLNLVDTLIDNYYPDLTGEPLHQQADSGPGRTSDDLELYRSAFFVRQRNAVFLPNHPPGHHGNDEFLNLLTALKDINTLVAERKLVSNLKLAHLGAYDFTIKFADPTSNVFGVREEKFLNTLPQLQQAVINYFIETILQKINQQTPEKTPVFLVVKLLMPNVFEQKKIARMIQGVMHYLAPLVAEAKHKLSGFEVSTLSESDAAFLGFKRERERALRSGQPSFFEKEGHYLIIDVGKGTTDFSIVHVGPEGELTSKYRSGFIGAGNVLSYAFVDTVFAALCGENTEARQRAIFSVVNRVGIADLLRFTDVVEQLKRDFNPNAAYKPLRDFVSFESVKTLLNDPDEPGALEALTVLLENVARQQGSIADELGIIRDSVFETANQIFKAVYYSGLFFDFKEPEKPLIRKVILTGRGFMFKPLHNAIEHFFGQWTIPTDTSGDLKKVCLAGSFSSDYINFESNLVGDPQVQSLFGNAGMKEPGNTPLNVIDRGNGDLTILPKYSPFRNITSLYREARPRMNAWLNGLKGEVNNSAFESSQGTFSVRDGTSTEEDFLLKGKTFTDFNRRAKNITICGLDYRQHTIDSPTVNVYYTGETFLIRSAEACSELELERDFFQRTHWVFRTLFPFSTMNGWQDVEVAPVDQDAF